MPSDASTPAFLFDLDGTLVDSVYQHVLAWRQALERGGISLAVWRIHRRIGMSGGLLVNALLRETGLPVTPDQTEHLRQLHAEEYTRLVGQVWDLLAARRAPSAWASCRAGMARTSSCVAARIGCTRTRPTSCTISTK